MQLWQQFQKQPMLIIDCNGILNQIVPPSHKPSRLSLAVHLSKVLLERNAREDNCSTLYRVLCSLEWFSKLNTFYNLTTSLDLSHSLQIYSAVIIYNLPEYSGICTARVCRDSSADVCIPLQGYACKSQLGLLVS